MDHFSYTRGRHQRRSPCVSRQARRRLRANCRALKTALKRNVLVLLAAAATAAGAAIAAPVETDYSTVELVVLQDSVPAGGGTVTAGFHLQPKPGWHAYWVNPGDAGLAPSLRWSLPEGFSAAALRFPAPHVIPFGEFVTYGFNEPVLLLADIEIPPGLPPAERYTLAAQARWVVCDDALCVPEQANVAATLPAGAGTPDPARTAQFAAAREKIPPKVDWPARFERSGEEVQVAVQTPTTVARLREAYLFVAEEGLVRYGRQQASFGPRGVVFGMDAGLRLNDAQGFGTVLAFKERGEQRAVWLEVRSGTDSLSLVAGAGVGGEPPLSAATAPPAATAGGGLALGYALLFAFLGGIVLNLMPCVFPILSMKALSLVQASGSDRRSAREGGYLYTAGILVAFAAVGAALLALRSAGQQVGWGFQMQSATVNLTLALLMLAIALNLLGVFEFGAKWAGVGEGLTGGGERKRAFSTGLLAVVVATPCTAPFMAGALGYALVQPAAVALGVFLLLGLGLAFPYLLLSCLPALGKLLPRPGPWMRTFRSVLAFPMFATAVWLFWIIGNQLGADAMAVGLLAALAFGFGLWAYGCAWGTTRPWLWRAVAIAGLAATVALGWKMPDYKSSGDAAAGTLGDLAVEPFAPERVSTYLGAKQPLFLYFTADWCVSCKVNERVALASAAVGEAFRSRGIKVMAGDWTNEDPLITAWLRRYGRVGVPLYLYYPSGSSLDGAAVLPQILVPSAVIDAIVAADAAVARLSGAGRVLG